MDACWIWQHEIGFQVRSTHREIFWNQTDIRLYLPFSDWFETKRTVVWFQINRKMINTIWCRFELIRFLWRQKMCNSGPWIARGNGGNCSTTAQCAQRGNQPSGVELAEGRAALGIMGFNLKAPYCYGGPHSTIELKDLRGALNYVLIMLRDHLVSWTSFLDVNSDSFLEGVKACRMYRSNDKEKRLRFEAYKTLMWQCRRSNADLLSGYSWLTHCKGVFTERGGWRGRSPPHP